MMFSRMCLIVRKISATVSTQIYLKISVQKQHTHTHTNPFKIFVFYKGHWTAVGVQQTIVCGCCVGLFGCWKNLRIFTQRQQQTYKRIWASQQLFAATNYTHTHTPPPKKTSCYNKFTVTNFKNIHTFFNGKCIVRMNILSILFRYLLKFFVSFFFLCFNYWNAVCSLFINWLNAHYRVVLLVAV